MKLSLISICLLINFNSFSQEVKVVKYGELEKYWIKPSDTLYVINFWATWCKPCIEELPDFYKLDEEFRHKPFKMLLVNLDFPNDLEKRVKPFIVKNNIKPTVLLLDDNPNQWIPKVDAKWDGAIPVTLLVRKNQRIFIPHQTNLNELKSKIVKLY
jgi:thiol-disulfide isomerase/thioredoxin